MKAGPDRQLRLLELQALDTRVGQLRHQRSVLPVLGELAAARAAAEALDDDIIRKRTESGDVQREVAKAEADVQLVRDRVARDQARLDSGVGTAKDLQAIGHELTSLARRQSELEDIELEVMERAEVTEAELNALTDRRTTLAAQVGSLQSQADRALADIDAELTAVAAPRESIVADVGADLVALYDKITLVSGSGAAALRQRRCLGCQLELNAVELGQIKAAPEDEVLRCDECRRILVRTPESGL